MAESLAIWAIILLSLVTANLPFLTERYLLVLPWGGGAGAGAVLRLLASLVFAGVLVAFGWGVLWLIGGAFLVVTDAGSVLLFLLRLVAVLAVAAALFWLPGRLGLVPPATKSFFARLLEVLVLFMLVGTLAFAFETSLGNRFVQGWEFYAITLSLYLVMAYPGFVFRYLMRRRKAGAAASAYE